MDWQDDDVPVFGMITDIIVVTVGTDNIIFFKVQEYTTLGIDHHYHSYLIEGISSSYTFIQPSEMKNYHPFKSHLKNGYEHIAFHSHIMKV